MSAETIEHVAPPVPQPREPTPADPVPVRLCECGHEPDAHEHYRPGSDCGVCGPVLCKRYRRRRGRGAR